METQFRKINDIALFSAVNQWDDKKSRMYCTIYAPFINAKYNTGIQFTEEDIYKVADKQISKWLLSETKWGKLSDWVDAVIEYLEEKHWKKFNLTISKDDTEAQDWLSRGFAVEIGIKVNKEWFPDMSDGKIDKFQDYINYKGNIWHATNICRWIGRGDKNASDYWNEWFLTSYVNKKSFFDADIKEVLEDIEMNTKYIIH